MRQVKSLQKEGKRTVAEMTEALLLNILRSLCSLHAALLPGDRRGLALQCL